MVGATTIIDHGGPAQTSTKLNNAVDKSLGHLPRPYLRVLGVVPRDVDVLVLAGTT